MHYSYSIETYHTQVCGSKCIFMPLHYCSTMVKVKGITRELTHFWSNFYNSIILKAQICLTSKSKCTFSLQQDGDDQKDDERMQRGGGSNRRAPRRFTRRFFRRKPRRPRSDTEGSQSGVEGETTNKVSPSSIVKHI